MMRTIRQVLGGVGFLGLTLLLGEVAFGHGGMYRGPGPSTPPPPGQRGPGTGGPGGPRTGPPAGGAATTIGGGRVRTGQRRAAGTDFTSWSTWWEFNKHPYLNLRARLASRFSVTGLGRSGVAGETKEGQPISARPTFDELKEQMLPVLRELLKADDPDIVDSAVLALARVTPAEHADLVLKDLTGALAHRERSVQQAAILGLGILGQRASVPLLLEILNDSVGGRKLLQIRQEVDDVQRALAAVALGYLSDPRAIPPLREIVERTPDSRLDFKAGAVLALGLFREGQVEVVPFLLEQLHDRRLSDLVKAQIPVALARLDEAARPVLPQLLKLVESQKTANLVRESCIVALGKLAAPEDLDVIKSLTRMAQRGTDQASVNFAFIALGEIGARAAADDGRHGEMRNDLTRFLLRNLTRPRKQSQLVWAATACALLGRSYAPESEERALIASKLAEAWKETRNPAQRGALAISLGLIEADFMGGELLEALKDSGDRDLNGYVAEALGLMRHEAAAHDLLSILKTDNDPQYRVRVATGLGLMGDLEVSGLLVTELTRARTLFSTSAVAKALGNVGDRTAIAPLLELVQTERRPGLARAFGAVALGLIGEKTPLPWNSRVSVGANYLAAFFMQSEIMDIL